MRNWYRAFLLLLMTVSLFYSLTFYFGWIWILRAGIGIVYGMIVYSVSADWKQALYSALLVALMANLFAWVLENKIDEVWQRER